MGPKTGGVEQDGEWEGVSQAFTQPTMGSAVASELPGGVLATAQPKTILHILSVTERLLVKEQCTVFIDHHSGDANGSQAR